MSPLAEIGFTQTHLMQLAKYSKLSATEVESSIAFFAFDLRRNGKAKALNGSPLNFFMGILRKGVPYAPPENYESAADEARRRTREILERKDRERQAEEQKIFELEFSEWRRGKAPNELMRLVPDWAQKPGQIQDNALKSHFETNVWPELQVARAGVSESERAQVRAAISQSLGEVQA
jgi:predicted type IV restriction endonuclease